MIVGVFSKEIGMIMAQTLALMEIEKAWVVCGAIGLDEVRYNLISDQPRRHNFCVGIARR
jgi:anthranilate phosphoribosyltransferase